MIEGTTNPDKQHRLTRKAIDLILAVENWDCGDTKVRVIDALTKAVIPFLPEDEYLALINEACEPGRREWDKMNMKNFSSK